MSVLPPYQAHLVVTYASGKPKLKRISVLAGFSPAIEYGVFNATIRTALKSVYERMLFVKANDAFVKPPEPKHSNIYQERLEMVSRWFSKVKRVAPLTQEQFLGTYDGRKRQMYNRACLSLKVKPFKRSDSYIKWFSKVEKQLFSEDKEPVPRGISPRSTRFHVSHGPYIKRVEKNIYKELGRMVGHHVIFKGLNARDRATILRSHWDCFQNPVAIGLDASRFDQHVSVEALEWTHSIYRNYFPYSKTFKRLCDLTMSNRCFVNLPDGSFSFHVKGKRMSGDMDTGLGNCLIATALTVCYCESKGIKYRIADDGDDIQLLTERRNLGRLDDLEEWYLEMGFSMKREAPVFEFEKIEFCQSRPVWTPEGYIMVRNPFAALAKDCISTVPFQSLKHARRWMKAVGDCGMSLTGGIPIFQSFYSRLIKEAGNVKALVTQKGDMSGMQRLAVGMKRNFQTIHPNTRVSFWRAFGIEPDKQLVMEREYQSRIFNIESDTSNHVIKDFPI